MTELVTTHYELELDVLARDRGLSDEEACELMRTEFRLAINASQFMAICARDIAVVVRSRSTPQEGVARYAVDLEMVERHHDLDDEQASALLRSEFQRALNAGHFWRVAVEDFAVTVAARDTVAADAVPVDAAA